MYHNRRESIIDKILTRLIEVDRGYLTPCWEWQGPTSGTGRGGGYGRMCLDGITVAVHIAMFVCCFGYIPPKKQVDHKCNNRLCCHPEHLQLVTHKQNMKLRDKRRKENV